MAARALRERFESIRQTELVRLRKKVSTLNDDEQAEVDAITLDIVQAIAAGPARVLADEPSPELVRTVIDLFRVA